MRASTRAPARRSPAISSRVSPNGSRRTRWWRSTGRSAPRSTCGRSSSGSRRPPSGSRFRCCAARRAARLRVVASGPSAPDGGVRPVGARGREPGGARRRGGAAPRLRQDGCPARLWRRLLRPHPRRAPRRRSGPCRGRRLRRPGDGADTGRAGRRAARRRRHRERHRAGRRPPLRGSSGECAFSCAATCSGAPAARRSRPTFRGSASATAWISRWSTARTRRAGSASRRRSANSCSRPGPIS